MPTVGEKSHQRSTEAKSSPTSLPYLWQVVDPESVKVPLPGDSARTKRQSYELARKVISR